MGGTLWAPWRMEYIDQPAEKACFLCEYPKLNNDDETFILARSRHCFVIINKYPYTNGHVLVAPFRHEGDPLKLTIEEYQDLTETVRKSVSALRNAIGPHGFNVGFNLGRVAGAGLEEHLHFHIVPRWNGDNNMMPVIGAVRVISEGLAATYKKLSPHFKQIIGSTR
ncbi:MAG: HIT domain-containing protein [Deltaproteobacteria bacterium]|nr:HIT domain-containing protein [Deltaproteobacteria bacterium]